MNPRSASSLNRLKNHLKLKWWCYILFKQLNFHFFSIVFHWFFYSCIESISVVTLFGIWISLSMAFMFVWSMNRKDFHYASLALSYLDDLLFFCIRKPRLGGVGSNWLLLLSKNRISQVCHVRSLLKSPPVIKIDFNHLMWVSPCWQLCPLRNGK